MKKPRHSQGPWGASSAAGLYEIHAKDGLIAFTINDTEIDLANAKLIAAATELLEALQDCVEIWSELEPDDINRPVLKRARAIIAKAGVK